MLRCLAAAESCPACPRSGLVPADGSELQKIEIQRNNVACASPPAALLVSRWLLLCALRSRQAAQGGYAAGSQAVQACVLGRLPSVKHCRREGPAPLFTTWLIQGTKSVIEASKRAHLSDALATALTESSAGSMHSGTEQSKKIDVLYFPTN